MKSTRTALAALPLALFSALPAFAQQAATAATYPTAANVNKGDTTWMLISTVLVILMSVPALALFYGGLVRSKNVLSILMQVTIAFSLVGILWVIYGYPLAFSAPSADSLKWYSPFIGDTAKLFLKGVDPTTLAATFSRGVYIPELTYVLFQMTFATITPALIIGATAERIKFSAMILFIVIWFTFAYLPIAHMVWSWAGPDAYNLSKETLPYIEGVLGKDAADKFLADLTAAGTDKDKVSAVLTAFKAAVDSTGGFLFQKGAIDFAGGTVVHINAGIAGLVLAIIGGRRVGYGKENFAPHNLTLTYIGAMLLWVGWYGFNAGSNLEATGSAAQAVLNTTEATMAAAIAWPFAEWLTRGHASLLGAASGAVAGLVAVTPASGFAGAFGSIAIGVAAGVICYWASTWLKGFFKYDDALDVFGVHCVGGIIGAILTGVFVAPSLGGMGVTDPMTGNVDPTWTMWPQVQSQFEAVATSLIWSGVVAAIAAFIVKFTIGLRHPEAREREGLDITDHGESAYNS